ncbi:MAG TPA: hypothetical protein VM240_11405 [Verrucomicrobiae bacterium]|nr:hypothetical protein [Verrucomicrobiae bacterium]
MSLYTHGSVLLSGTVLVLISSILMLSAPLPATPVGVPAVNVDPDFYGRIALGSAPPPRILYEPMIIERGPRQLEPIYLRVRPGEARRWKLHCSEYDACGQRVYFVQDEWYRDVYATHYALLSNRD